MTGPFGVRQGFFFYIAKILYVDKKACARAITASMPLQNLLSIDSSINSTWFVL